MAISSPVGSLGGNNAPREIDSAARPSPQRKLGFHGMTEHGAGRPHREIGVQAEKGPFFSRHRFGAGGAGDDGAVAVEPAKLRPELLQRRRNLARMPAERQVGDDLGQAGIGFGAAGLRMGF